MSVHSISKRTTRPAIFSVYAELLDLLEKKVLTAFIDDAALLSVPVHSISKRTTRPAIFSVYAELLDLLEKKVLTAFIR